MADWLEGRGVRFVVLAGYMHLLRPNFLARFPGRVVNTHSAPLPAFPGAHPIEDVLAAGVAETAATIHYVDDGIDTGAVIAAERVPVLAGRHARLAARPRPGRRASPAARGREGADRRMRRALLSVFDKTGIAAFATELVRLDFELVASGGTATLLADEGIPVIRLEELTGFAEMLGHRVVTLHPAVHGGILARRDVPEDVADLATHGIDAIDLVCVNLYPFEQTVGRLDVEWDEAIEKIDVGGPALLRGAAKNHAHVIPVCRPEDYELVLAELRRRRRHGRDPPRARRARLHPHRRRTTAPSRGWLSRGLGFPETLRAGVRSRAGALVRREPASARGLLLRSAAPARTCSRASSSSTASRSRSTTSTTSPPPACSRSSSTGRPA